jgi:hypothetical protein
VKVCIREPSPNLTANLTPPVFAVDWVLFSKVFEVLVKLMNTLSRHFTSRLDESVVSNPLPEIRLDGAKSSR